ncbi:hypothetical protein SO802_001148 [Lithocarpus litseifolius]|uniref:Uncharacterized protein n=1 Tax=Lithocarpus litseifolius TaxID=425828 RepID=A0AAW2DXB5_9ROSI
MEGDNGDNGEQGQDDVVVDSDAEEEEWTIAEEVEERPGDEDGEEDDHGDRVPEEAEIEVRQVRDRHIIEHDVEVPSALGELALHER